MKKILTLGILLLVGLSFASEYTFTKQVNIGKLQAALIANGYDVDYIRGDGLNFTIQFKNNEVRNPQSIIDAQTYTDYQAKIVNNSARMKILARKWIQNTITLAEKEELLKRFIVSTILLDELDD